MEIRKIDSAAQSVSLWSGGTTTQLAIWPPEALYGDRDFLWRLSSAVVELPESDFTPLPDYRRILMILHGSLELSHDGGPLIFLRELEQNTFDGASHTTSRGEVTDFNLMMRKGGCDGAVEARSLLPGESWQGIEGIAEKEDWQLIYCYQGGLQITVDSKSVRELAAGEALLVHGIPGETCPITMISSGEETTAIAAYIYLL